LISPNTTSKEQAAQVKEAAGGPLGVALECTGVEGSIHTAIYVSSSYPNQFKNLSNNGTVSLCNLEEKSSSLVLAKMNKWYVS
jgi:hypothetical protein